MPWEKELETSLATDRLLRPLGHNNTHNLSVLIIGIENVRALL